jgi:hypothetical protein
VQHSSLYQRIIEEQIRLQEMEADAGNLRGCPGSDEGQVLSSIRRLKQQRTVVAMLWREAESVQVQEIGRRA